MDLEDLDSDDDGLDELISFSTNESDEMDYEESEISDSDFIVDTERLSDADDYSLSQSPPPSDVSQSPPPTDVSQSPPPTDVSQSPPPNAMRENPSPNDLPDTPLVQRLRSHALPLPDTEEDESEPIVAVTMSNAATAHAENRPAADAKVINKELTAAAPSVSYPKDSNSDEDGQTCTICFEQWSNMSEHRLVSLRCGHLFGRSCITRWLMNEKRCPQCNAVARKSEVRNIYAKAVKVIDSSERDKALQDLMKESELRRKAEMKCAQERLKHMMAVQECERLKKELMEANRLLLEYRAGSTKTVSGTQTQKGINLFRLEKCIDIAKQGGCRIVNSSSLLGMIVISQPSINEIFSGHGFRKISTHDMKPSEFILVHQKPIRDMAFHMNDGLVLTASQDKSLKLTNVLSNSVVQTFNMDTDVWSCAWDTDDPTYFYGGLRTGEVYVFDIRVTSRHVCQLSSFADTPTPVVALQYFKSPMSARYRGCGPIVGQISGCALQQKTGVLGSYKPVPLPSPGPLISVSSENSGQFLVSCRPSQKQPCVSHTLCEFEFCHSSDDLVCNPILTVCGGKSQVQLTRSKVLAHPDNESSVLICAGDEDSNGALIWDGSSGKQIDLLHSDSPVLDFAGLKINQNSFVTALTDKTLRVYQWTGV